MKDTQENTQVRVVNKLTENQLAELHVLFQGEWWTATRTLAETVACVSGSQICIGLVDSNGSLVGFARVLTDFMFKAFIFDVIVSPAARGLKLGRKLMGLIKNHPELIKVKHFELYCKPELCVFYEAERFSRDVGDIVLMRHQA